MTADGEPLSDGDRRRQLRFRSWHRGTKEADLLLGTFADRYLESFDRPRLERYAQLLEVADPDLWDWLVGREPTPPEYETDIMQLLRQHKLTERFA